MSIGAIETEGDLESFIQRVIDGSDLGVIVRQLQQAMNDIEAQTGKRSFTMDAGAMTFAASSAELETISHGLGTTPEFAACIPIGFQFAGEVDNLGASTFDALITAMPAIAPYTGNVDFVWLAIG